MNVGFRAGLTALLCLSLTACGGAPSSAPAADNTSAPTGGMMLVNPMQAKTSLDEVNNAVGCSMKAPADLTVSDEQFFVISGTVGEYRFTADGISYTLRVSATTDDISGVYVNGAALGAGEADTAIFDGGMWTRWFDGDLQYSLVSSETGATDTSTLYAVRDALR